jgi:hypothetical protein
VGPGRGWAAGIYGVGGRRLRACGQDCWDLRLAAGLRARLRARLAGGRWAAGLLGFTAGGCFAAGTWEGESGIRFRSRLGGVLL